MGADVDDATAERLVKSLDLNGRSVVYRPLGVPWVFSMGRILRGSTSKCIMYTMYFVYVYKYVYTV